MKSQMINSIFFSVSPWFFLSMIQDTDFLEYPVYQRPNGQELGPLA